jgi:hypothetical protein
LAKAVPRVSHDVFGLPRSSDSDRVAEADLVAAETKQCTRDVDAALEIHVAFVGATPHRRYVRPYLDVGAQRLLHEVFEDLERPFDGFVRVLQVVRFARGHEDRDLRQSGADGALEALAVGDQRAEAHAARASQIPRQLVGVRKLRDPAGRHEARDLDSLEPTADQRLDEQRFLPERDQRGLVLEPIAGSNFVDGNA